MNEQGYAIYNRIQDAPKHRQTLRGAVLQLDQINWLTRRAYELGTEFEVPDTVKRDGDGNVETDENGNPIIVKGGVSRADNWAAAIAEFEQTHEIQDNFWVPKKVETTASSRKKAGN